MFPTGKHTYANITVPNGASANTVLTSNGTGANWSISGTASWYTKQPKVKITENDIEIDGLSLGTTLRVLQERLAIMVPNPELEREFDELKACGDRYRELEKEFTEQLKVWNTLKSTDR
jgi:hypothetical protein